MFEYIAIYFFKIQLMKDRKFKLKKKYIFKTVVTHYFLKITAIGHALPQK